MMRWMVGMGERNRTKATIMPPTPKMVDNSTMTRERERERERERKTGDTGILNGAQHANNV
jgi:hypothetical protein